MLRHRSNFLNLEELLSRIALAFGSGLLIGLERGWRSRKVRSGGRTAGVRTFAISGLLGGLAAALAQSPDGSLSVGGGILLGAVFATYALVIMTFSRDENRAANTFSATTTIAALLTFALGAYALIGDVRVTAAVAVAAAGILMVRETLHQWVAKLTLTEFESGLLLLAMTFIALPVVPNRPVGPLGGVNLHEIWVIAIVLAAVSFAGYVAVKLLGERRGVLIAAAAGGLVSSTAVTLANARRAAAHEGSPHLLAAGTALAAAVSFVRVVGIVAVLGPSVLLLVGPALLAGAIVAAATALIAVYGFAVKNSEQAAVHFHNPFAFWQVVGMAALMGALILASRLVNEQFGAAGAVVGATAMGLFDVDAMTVSIVRLLPQSLQQPEAAYAILAGVASNTVTKIAIGAVIGRGRFAAEIAAVSLACIVAGWLVLLATMALLGP